MQPTETDPAPASWTGKLTIVSIFALAMVAGLFAVWYRSRQGPRCLALWGTESALLIRYTQQVELLRLAEIDDAGDQAERLSIGPRSLVVVDSRDVARVVAVADVRKGLVYDASFAWDEPLGDCRPQWQYALRFRDGESWTVVLFDFPCRMVRHLPSGREASIAPIANSVERIFSEQLDDGGG